MKKLKSLITTVIVILIFANPVFGQQEVQLADALKNEQLKVVNRTAKVYDEQEIAVELNAEKSDGLGVLQKVEFETGIIEVELLGENNPGRSFIGIAFNIKNDETYEAVYFRPFNFVATEQIRRDHMVQYIHHPEFTWKKLRAERTGEFENEIMSPPNPDNWFKARIHITEKEIAVFVNERSEPVLTFDRLTTTTSNKIGLWTGFGSSGRFRNLVLNPE